MDRMNIGIVCVGGGRGERFGGDKLAEVLGTRTVLEHALTALKEALPEATAAVVLPQGRLPFWQERLAPGWPDLRWVEGGDRRQDSVRSGVEAVAHSGIELVVIHDGARPAVHPDDVRAAVGGIESADGCVLGRRATDTVKRVDRGGWVTATLPRSDILMAETPQVFRLESLRRAWESGDFSVAWTDEAALLERCGFRVKTVDAGYPNPKLTSRADLSMLRTLKEWP